MTTTAKRNAALREIASRELLIETLERRNSSDDFHEVAVWMVAAALDAAYEAGRSAAAVERIPPRIDCPACKRQIRISPIT